MQATQLLLVGRLARAHGLRGECKVIPESDDPSRLLALGQVWVGASPDAAAPVTVSSARLQTTRRGTLALVRLNGAQCVEEASAFRGQNVYARMQDLPPLAPREHFLHDLIGMTVTLTDGAHVGRVRDVWEMPANNMYVVTRQGRADALIPAVPAFVQSVDTERRTIAIRPIDGLLD